VSGLIRHLAILQSHVFLLNSRLGHFSAPWLPRGAFSRSYSTILPSSLAMIHSSTLGFSPQPPVSVYGTGVVYVITLSGFSREPDYNHYPFARKRTVLSGSTSTTDLPVADISTPFNALFRQCAGLSLLRHHITCIQQYWNINQLSIGFASRLPLRPRLTLIRLALIRKPWLFGVQVSRLHYRYLCLHFRFQTLQPASQQTFYVSLECSPTTARYSGNPPLR
jgi:hypothetical protein